MTTRLQPVLDSRNIAAILGPRVHRKVAGRAFCRFSKLRKLLGESAWLCYEGLLRLRKANGDVWPSYRWLAKTAGQIRKGAPLTHGQVQHGLRVLAKLGLIKNCGASVRIHSRGRHEVIVTLRQVFGARARARDGRLCYALPEDIQVRLFRTRFGRGGDRREQRRWTGQREEMELSRPDSLFREPQFNLPLARRKAPAPIRPAIQPAGSTRACHQHSIDKSIPSYLLPSLTEKEQEHGQAARDPICPAGGPEKTSWSSKYVLRQPEPRVGSRKDNVKFSEANLSSAPLCILDPMKEGATQDTVDPRDLPDLPADPDDSLEQDIPLGGSFGDVKPSPRFPAPNDPMEMQRLYGEDIPDVQLPSLRVPKPPQLPEKTTSAQRARFLANTYTSYLKKFYGIDRTFLFNGPIHRSKFFFPLVKACKALEEHDLTPAAWMCWLDHFVSNYGKLAGKNKPPSVSSFTSLKMIAARRGWARSYAAAAMPMPSIAITPPELAWRRTRMEHALVITPINNREDVLEIVRYWLPEDFVDLELRIATAAALERLEHLSRRAADGEYIWHRDELDDRCVRVQADRS